MRRAMILFLLALPILAAPVPEPPTASVTIPGGVADADGKVGFVAGERGGIDALALTSGKVLWSSKAAQKVVAVDGKHVLALAGNGNTLRVVTLNAADGKQLAVSEAVRFPDWVAVRLGVVSSDAGRSFQVTARLEKGNLYLRWQARSWYWGGAPPPPQIQAAARRNADGVVRVNLESGKVETIGAEKWPADTGVSAEVAKVAAGKRLVVVGDLAVAVDVEGQKAVLKRWRLKDAKALEPVTLLESPALRVELAAGSGRVMIHKALTKEALPAGDYAWWIFDLATGKQVGKIEFTPTTRAAALVGPRAFFVVAPPTIGRPPAPFTTARLLRAVDIASGKTLWEHPLEAERRMPPPP